MYFRIRTLPSNATMPVLTKPFNLFVELPNDLLLPIIEGSMNVGQRLTGTNIYLRTPLWYAAGALNLKRYATWHPAGWNTAVFHRIPNESKIRCICIPFHDFAYERSVEPLSSVCESVWAELFIHFPQK